MIFAAWDYLQYRRQKGKYGESPLDASLQIAFCDEIPENVVKQLNIGDMVITQRLDNWLSWAIMYFTKSPFDHVAMYAGDEKVAHVTLGGFKQHSLQTVAKGARTVICRLGHERYKWVEEFQREKEAIDVSDSFVKNLPPKVQFAFGALRIASGRYPDRLQLTIIIDVILFLSALEVAFGLTIGFHLGAALLILYFVLLALNFSKFAYRRAVGKSHPVISHPDIIFRCLIKSGGLIFTTLGPVVVCDLGIIPLKVVLRLAGQSANYGPYHELKEAREFFVYLIEGWDLKPEAEKAKNDDSDKK